MNNYRSLRNQGRQWQTKCLLMMTMLGLGWYSDQLLLATCTVILAFGFWDGRRPWDKFAKDFDTDVEGSYAEMSQVKRLTRQAAERLTEVNTAGCHSAMKLAVTVAKLVSRMSEIEAVEICLARAVGEWTKQLAPLRNASEQATMIGFLGSLFGIISAMNVLAKADSEAEIYGAFALMAVTTAVGIGVAIWLRGLYTRALNGVASFEAELRMFGYALPLGEKSNDSFDGFLF